MKRTARLIVVLLLLGTAIATGWGAATAFGALWEFNTVIATSDLAVGRIPLSTKILDRNGRLLNEVFHETRRTYTALNEVSPFLRQATIATEDAGFYTNLGVSPRGIARALWNNLTNPDSLQGGSTITQQLIKNTIIPEEERYERTAERKVREALLALLMTRSYAKDQILEWYLNQVFYGNNSYGIETAAQSYFGKTVRDLTLAESAMLAGLPAAPAFYDPYTRPDQARARQALVLGLMVRHGYITEDQAQAAAGEELQFRPQRFGMEAPHFVMYMREALEVRYGPDALYRGGLQVTTTLDLDLQHQAEAIIREQIGSAISQRRNARNAALVSMRPKTGEVLALVGSADWQNHEIGGQVNMALAERQPGSTFKPITYVGAFMKGWTPATRVTDQATPFSDGRGGQWIPKNSDGKYRGLVTVRQALALSLNTPAVLALQFAGLPQTLELAHRLGITTLLRNDYGLAVTLGGGEVKLVDMVYAYAVFANNGMQYGQPRPRGQLQPGMRELDPVVILKVEGPNGKVLEEFGGPQRRQILPAPYGYLITDILSDNATRAVFFGPNSPLVLPGRPAAVKTGTTDDNRDNWTIGYTPDLVTGVWVGNTDNKRMAADAFGSSTAAPIWNAFTTAALDGTPAQAFVMPPGLVRAPVCQSTGKPPGRRGCSDLREELFVQGETPGAGGGDLVHDRKQDNQELQDELQKTIGDLERTIAGGKIEGAREQAQELIKEVQALERDGELSPNLAKQYLNRLTALASPATATASPSPANAAPAAATANPSGTAASRTTPTPSKTGTPRSTPSPAATATPRPATSPTPASSSSPSPAAFPSGTRTPSFSPTPLATATPRRTTNSVETGTPDASVTPSPSATGTAAAAETSPTPVPTVTPSPTALAP